MEDLGSYIRTLREQQGLYLEAAGKLVNRGRSVLSRLENGDYRQPYKGRARQLIIALGEYICTSTRETERYLQLARLDRKSLAELDEIRLGFVSTVLPQSPHEIDQLQHLEQLYTALYTEQEAKEREFGVNHAPQCLKLKVQEYHNALDRIKERINQLTNKGEVPSECGPILAHYATKAEGKLIVGHLYGAELMSEPEKYHLLALASPGACWLLEQTDSDYFAVDDCIVLVNSRDFRGWEQHEIETTLTTTRMALPHDLDDLRQETQSEMEQHYSNGAHYRLVSFTPTFSNPDRLKVTLAPINFYDYFSLSAHFDEPLLIGLDGKKTTIREKYGNTALTYISTEHGTALIPAPISIQCVVVTKDEHIILMRRSSLVAFYPNHWSASFEETMNSPISKEQEGTERSYDGDFFEGATRGLEEEFAIQASTIESMKVLSLNVEYLTFSVDVITLVRLNMTADEIREHWLLHAWDKSEAAKFALVSTDMEAVIDKMFDGTLWHPTSRMRMIQYLFHRFGVEAVSKAIKERNGTHHQNNIIS